MRWVVFLRAVNVGRANLCRPAELAKQLGKFGVVNIGAVGTFVARENVSESALPRGDCQKAAVQMRDHDLSRARHHQTCIKESILRTTFDAEHNSVRECAA
jgi:uncharacterized protein (DUF1697 family)